MFIKKMLQIMKQKNITRRKISTDLGFGINQIKYWETHGNIPSGDIVKRISEYLDTTPEYLFSEDDVSEEKKASEKKDGIAFPSADPLSKDESKLLLTYKILTEEGKKKAADYLDDLAGNPNYVSDDEIIYLPTAAFDGRFAAGEKVPYTAKELRMLLNAEGIEGEDF